MGYAAGSSYTSSESSNIVIASPGVVGESNTIRIGDMGVGLQQQNICYIAGITGITAAGSPVAVSSTGQLSDLGFGTATQVLTSNGAGVSPTWQAAGGGGTTVIFSAYLSSTQSNVTGDGTNYTIPFNTALVNTGSGFNTGTGVFTAPSTGNYTFSSSVYINGLLTGHTEGIFIFQGNAQESRFFSANFGAMATTGTIAATGTLTIPMTAGDTMEVRCFVNMGTKVVNVIGAGSPAIYTNFSGYLIP